MFLGTCLISAGGHLRQTPQKGIIGKSSLWASLGPSYHRTGFKLCLKIATAPFRGQEEPLRLKTIYRR